MFSGLARVLFNINAGEALVPGLSDSRAENTIGGGVVIVKHCGPPHIKS
jgi:hypothetical protein